MEGSRKRRPRNVPARMAEYISDFVLEEGGVPRTSPYNDFSPQPSTPPPLSSISTAKLNPNPATPPPMDDKDLDHSNHDMCDNCGDGGDLLCCDRCPASFHLLCAEPPLSAIPDGDWYCKQCTSILFPQPVHLLPKNPIAAALLRHLAKLNPHIYTLPKEIFEAAKKGKGFSEGGEVGRQMGSGMTAVDVFGNRILQGTCSICTVEGKQTDLISCSVCKTLYHTYCMDPVLTSKPTGFWICPNHDASMSLPPGVARMVKVTPANPHHREIVHLLPGDTMRLDFDASPYGGTSDDSDSPDSDLSDESSDPSDASGPPGHRRKAPPPVHSKPIDTKARSIHFQAMIRALHEAQLAREARPDYNRRQQEEFDSYTYLEEFYDEEAYEEIDLYTPPEDQTRLLLNLGRPQRLRFNIYDPAMQNQSKQLEDLLAQQRTFTRAALPDDAQQLASLLPPTSSTPTPNGTSHAATPSSTSNNTTDNNKMDTTPDTTPTVTVTPPTDTAKSTTATSDSNTSSNNNNNAFNNNNNAATIPDMNAIFAHGVGSPVNLSQLSPLFTQFLAWQRLMQINQEIQQQTLPPQQQALIQQQKEQLQAQKLQQQQTQIRQYYENFQNEQRVLARPSFHAPPSPPRRWGIPRDAMDMDPLWRQQETLPYSSVVPRPPRIPPRAKSPRSKPFAKSAWMRERFVPVPPPSSSSSSHSTTAPPLSERRIHEAPTKPDVPTHISSHTPSYHTPASKPKVVNHTSSYGNPARSTPSSQFTPGAAYVSPFQVSPISSEHADHNTTMSDHSTNEISPFTGPKSSRGRKRKVVSPEAPTSPSRKSTRRGKKADDDEENDEKDDSELKETRREPHAKPVATTENGTEVKVKKKPGEYAKNQLRGWGGRFMANPAMPGKSKKGKKDSKGEKEERTPTREGEARRESRDKTVEGDTPTKEGDSMNTSGESRDEKLDTSTERRDHVSVEDFGRLASLMRESASKLLQSNGALQTRQPEKDKEGEKTNASTTKDSDVAEKQETPRYKDSDDVKKELMEEEEDEPLYFDESEMATTHTPMDSTPVLSSPPPSAPKNIEATPLSNNTQTEFKSTPEYSTPTTPTTTTTTTSTSTTPTGPAEVGPKRSTRVREKGEKRKEKEAEEAAREKKEEEEKKEKAKKKEAKKEEAKKEEAKKVEVVKKEGEFVDGAGNVYTHTIIPGTVVADKVKKDKKRKKEDSEQGAEKKKKTEKKKKEGEKKEGEKKEGEKKEGEKKEGEKKEETEDVLAFLDATGTTKPFKPRTEKAAGAREDVLPLDKTYLQYLEDKTKYTSPIAQIKVAVTHSELDGPVDKSHPTSAQFKLLKRVTSIGRNRQSKRSDDPVIDIDLAQFGPFARAASHLHAYIVHSPPELNRNLPEFSIWLMGRNLTKVDGFLYKESIVPLGKSGTIKITKGLGLDFCSYHDFNARKDQFPQ